MTETTHPAAIVVQEDEPIGIVVEVDPELLDALGEDVIYDAVQQHPWASRQGVPIVVGCIYDDELSLIGPEDLADYVATIWEDIPWNYPLTLEWKGGEDEEG